MFILSDLSTKSNMKFIKVKVKIYNSYHRLKMLPFWAIFYILFSVLVSIVTPTSLDLIFSASKEIRNLDKNFIYDKTINSTVIKSGLEESVAVDFDYDERIIFWSDTGVERINSMHLNDNRVSEVIVRGIIAPDGLACDWITKKIYWADSETNKIEVANYNGSSRAVLFWENLDQPRAIALVPAEGIIFFSDWGMDAKIERASMDGNNSTRQVIIHEDLLWPNGLAVDHRARKLYWVDAKLGSISFSDFDGRNREKVNCSQIQHPFALTMLADILYWTDWSSHEIYSCNKTSGFVSHTKETRATKPMGLTIFDSSRQPKSMSPCLENNGNCSHLCLLSSIEPYYSCACPTGIQLSSDRKTCPIFPNKMVLLAQRNEIRRISLDTGHLTTVVLPFKGIRHATVLDFDPVEERVYYADEDYQVFRRVFLNGSQSETIINEEVDRSDGIAIDWVARNFYWTDTGTDRIEVARLDGSCRRVIISDGLDAPRAIAVHPNFGLLFWTDWGKEPRIERSALDGSQRKIIIEKDIVWPNGLVIDYELSHIYWADAKQDRIERANFDGTGRRQIFKSHESSHFFGFSLLDEWIYWSDWQKRSVERVHKLTGNMNQTIADTLPDIMGIKAVWLKNPFYFKNNDQNPCFIKNGNCSHLCLNRPHHQYVCACPFGYNLMDNGRNCEVSHAHLVLLRPQSIASYFFQTKNFDNLRISGLNPSSMGVNIAKNRIYWIDATERVISRALFNTTYHETLVHVGLEAPESLVVDWISGNIYWTDTAAKRIEVARDDGSFRKVIFHDQKRTPSKLAIDPIVGYLFWTEKSGRIERSSLGGDHVKAIVTDTSPIDAIISPNIESGSINGGSGSILNENVESLITNHHQQKLYWVYNRAIILSCNYDGSEKTFVYQVNPTSGRLITRIAFDNETILLLDSHSGTIDKIHLSKKSHLDAGLPEPIELVQSDQLKNVTDLFIFHPLYQQGWNACAAKNGECEHLCFLIAPAKRKKSSDTVECACATHFNLVKTNNKQNKCIPPESFILYSQRTSVTRFLFNRSSTKNDFQEVTIPISIMKNVKAMAYDPYDSSIYWIDSGKNSAIKRAGLNGNNTEVLLNSAQTDIMPLDLVVDPYSRILFWSCGITNSINATRLIGKATSIGSVYRNPNDKPHLLAYHVGQNFLFWTNDIHPPQIERIDFPGHMKTTVVADNLHKILSIAVDHELNFLIWADKTTNKIEYSDLDGKHRLDLHSEPDIHPLSMASYSKYLFWIEKDRKSIEKISLDLNVGNKKQTIYTRLQHLSDLIAVQPMKKNSTNLFCMQENSGCSHICLNNIEGKVKCACPRGLVLASKDEKNCIEPVKCDSRQFSCLSGTACIDPSLRCNGIPDCLDNSDESDCPKCTLNQFSCMRNTAFTQLHSSAYVYSHDREREHNQGLSCLDVGLLCDKKEDCLHGEDEKCCGDKFRCKNQHCLTADLVCNGQRDCLGGEDEEPAFCVGRGPVKKPIEPISMYIIFSFIALAVGLGIFVFCRTICNSSGRLKDPNSNTIHMIEHTNGEFESSFPRHPFQRRHYGDCNTMGSSMSGFDETHLMGMDVNGNGAVSVAGGVNQSNFCPSLQKPLLDGIHEDQASASGASYQPPPPSPVTTERSQSAYSSHSSTLFVARTSRNGTLPTKSGSNHHPRRHKKHSKWSKKQKFIPTGPPPTPCLTDNYEEFQSSSSRKYAYHNNRSDDDDEINYQPPPPTPNHYFSDPSCPPSPSPGSRTGGHSNPSHHSGTNM